MEPIRVSGDVVLDTLRAVVAEQPEHVYSAPDHMRTDDNGEECFYVHVDENGENPVPGCLIGEVLHRIGVPLDVLARHEHMGAGVVVPSVIETSRDALLALGEVQDAQDTGDNWARALAMVTDRALI